jgi:hypothetical protein
MAMPPSRVPASNGHINNVAGTLRRYVGSRNNGLRRVVPGVRADAPHPEPCRDAEWSGLEFAFQVFKEADMLFTLAIILLVAWMLGLVGVYTVGAVFHLLLVAAIVLFLVGLVSGRRAAI